MKQVFIGGVFDELHITNTEFNFVVGGIGWVVSPSDRAQAISSAGTFKNLHVKLDGVPGTGTYTFTLHHYKERNGKSWADSILTCTVASDGTISSDTVNEVVVSPGDMVCLKCAPSSPDNARNAIWSMMFEGDTANESLILTGAAGITTGDRWWRLGDRGAYTSEDAAKTVCPTSGTIKNLYVNLKNDPGTAPDAYRFTLRLNGATVAESLIVTIIADDITGNDTTHNLAVVAGDILTLLIEPLNAPAVSPEAAIGFTFLADTDGESIWFGGTANDLDDTATEFTTLVGGNIWNPTENFWYMLAQGCTLKNLYILLNGSPGAGKDYTFTVRYDGGSPGGGLVVVIADAAITGNDISNSITVADGKTVDIMVVPTGTPTVRDAYWGLVSFIVPEVVGIENKSANMAAKMMARGVI